MGAPDMIVNGTAAGGPPIGGTGTTNTIPRWTGASTLGDSVITQSGTLIGVNKAIPTSTIDVDGLQTNSSGTSAVTPTGTLRLNFAGQPTPGYGASIVFSQQWFAGSPTNYVAVGQITGVKTVSAGFFGGGVALWYNNGGNGLVEGMRINDTGNVGIGTASPGARLDVSDTANQLRATVSNSTPAVTTYALGTREGYISARQENSGSFNVFTDIVSSTSQFTPSGLRFFTHASGDASISERARIDSAGRLLVGASTAPSAAGARILASANAAGINTGVQINSGTNAAGTGIIINGRATGGADFFYYTGGIGSESYVPIVSMTTTELDASLRSGYGIKLRATPDNPDTQTLDCYLDGGASGGATWAPVDNSGAGLTFTVTSARYMRIGRLVLASFDITFPATASAAQAAISLPVTAQAVWQGASIGYGPNIPGLSATVINGDLNFWTYLLATTNAALSGTRLIVSMSYFAN